MTAREIIEILKLEPLPHEGGHFRQTYLSQDKVPHEALPVGYEKDMSYGTAIYALLTTSDFSAMHILDSDEIYHFYEGDPLELLLLYPDGHGEICVLGTDLSTGMRPQKLAPKGVWQGSRPVSGGPNGYSLVGTTMAPAFEWDNFRLGKREELLKKYPEFANAINARIR